MFSDLHAFVCQLLFFACSFNGVSLSCPLAVDNLLWRVLLLSRVFSMLVSIVCLDFGNIVLAVEQIWYAVGFYYSLTFQDSQVQHVGFMSEFLVIVIDSCIIDTLLSLLVMLPIVLMIH